jgi:hypothetical protein
MPTPSSRRPSIGPVVAPRIGRQRQPWQDEPVDAPDEAPDEALDEAPDDWPALVEDEERTGGGLIGLLVVVVVLLVALPLTFWFLDYGGLNPFASGSTRAGRPPSALPPTGSYVDARVQPGGTDQVTQWVRPPARLTSVDLKAQPRSGPDAVATGLQLQADGVPVSGPTTVGHDLATYRWRSPARVLRATYTLGHVVAKNRTTARLTVLSSTFLAARYPDRGGPVVVRVSGAGVTGVDCATVLGHAPPVPCGRQLGGSGWQVQLSGADFTHRVLAKVGAS